MKELLFKLLSELKPYQTLDVYSRYGEETVCRADACFPIALSMDPADEYEFAAYYDEQQIDNYNHITYSASHTIEYNGRQYVIRHEIIGVDFEEEYFAIHFDGCYGKSSTYISYDSISRIKIRDKSSYLSEIYNKMQYELSD
jgi:hypothetical protein